MLAIPTALLPLFLLTPVCGAANLQGDWVFPRNPDYSTVLQLGREYKIQWTSALQSWFPDYCPDCKPDSVDLWVTDSTSHQQHKIASSVNVTSALPMAWTATMSPTEISHYPTWVLRFLPSGKDLSSAHQEISSPIFVITDQDAASSSGSLVSLPTTSSTTPASSSPTMRSSAATDTETMTTPPSETITTLPSEMITTPPSSSELSTGARAGIGIGVGVGAIVLFTLGWFSARHYRSEDHTPTPGAAETQDRGPEVSATDYRQVPHEIHGTALQEAYPSVPPQTYSQPHSEAEPSHAHTGWGYAPRSATINEMDGSQTLVTEIK